MCGIVGYLGFRNATEILINGLKRLEYRGYDSAGIALILDNKLKIYKCKGKVADLENLIKYKNTISTIGIGHTRWATHGEPNDINAHPHQSMKGYFSIIHNGIIENYIELRTFLQEKDYKFIGETDTEILANFFEYVYLKNKTSNENYSPEDAIRACLQKVDGAYGLVILCKDTPNQLIAARKSSPLVIGSAKKEYFIASDASCLVEYTDRVIYLDDNDIAIINNRGLTITDLENNVHNPIFDKIEVKLEEIEKAGFDHYMLKEIFEQPTSIHNTFRGRLNLKDKSITLGGLQEIFPELVKAKRIIIIACGTSWHAGLVGEYLFEELARIPTEVEYASEFRYRNPIIFEDDIILAISQSGETADTLAAIKLAKKSGAKVIGICNVVGSSIARETIAGVYTHAGAEIGVASTKAFTSQITILTMMALSIGLSKKTISKEQFDDILIGISEVPNKIEEFFKTQTDNIKEISEKIYNKKNSIYLGRGYLYPVAMEGALKLKEISYIHAEGYPAAEMKHGPIALIDEEMPVVVIAPKENSYDKIVSNIQEVKARHGIIIAIVTKGEKNLKNVADYIIEIPETEAQLLPLISVIPLQLLAYYIATKLGKNVDQPRNLAKSVTVE
ncbi:MAG: glutamine--fructose-6-phosphate transaminase (isomerizing) [Bacteroidales bacterium]|jgi:glucosamine--fructose-6-phosphate aminotransferase (isomerizing)|nr:glutamine--fructose-6-phosphate transaminase (isomerizing) [Bacteroidales bacterium]